MTVAAFENALRVAASTWAGVNGYAFAWDNGPPVDPRAAPTLVWSFRTASEERLTVDVVLAEGVATGTLWLPAGRGGLAALAVAKSLRDALADLAIGGGETGKDVEIGPMRREGPSLQVDVSVPWELDERRVVVGPVGPQGEATEVTAYQAFRERWEQLVRVPLGMRTFFDDSPPDDSVAPPWCLATWRTLRPIPIERGRQRVPGRVIAALNLPIATGVQVANTAAPLIAGAFTDCTVRGVVFGTPVTTRVGATPRNTWQTNVRLPFHFDQRT